MTNINEYFSLGLTNEDDPIVDDVVINTIRTPPDTKSTNFNRIIVSLPKVGLLTKDSCLVVQPRQAAASTHSGSNVSVNIVNGVLGAVKRCTLTIDGKELTNIEHPSLVETNRMYAKNTPAAMADYQRAVLGNAFEVTNIRQTFKTATSQGMEVLSQNSPVVVDQDDNIVVLGNKLSKTTANNTKYSVPLHMLGMSFLRHEALPVHLMKDREIVLEVEFDSDCRNWCFCAEEALGASDCEINLDACELVTTHIQQNEELEQSLFNDLKETSRVYDLVETYLIKQSMVSNNVDTQTNTLVRLNLQNRELQKILQVQHNVEVTGEGLCANQASVSLGDVSLNHRANGRFIFDRRVSNNAQLYYLNSIYNGEDGLKVSNNAWSQTDLQTNAQLTSPDKDFTEYCGNFNYLGVSYRNGNSGVFGAGTVQTTPLEIHFDNVSRKQVDPVQVGEKDLFYFVSVSKRLVIGPANVMMSF